MSESTEDIDPRLTDKLPRTAVLLDTQIALTFVPTSENLPPVRAHVTIDKKKIDNMLVRLRQGKIRLQVGNSFGEREIIFENAAEVFFLMNMLDRFVTDLPQPKSEDG